MVKHFNIIMAGVISGIVALFTSYLGISGTIIGSVISSFLYQLLSTYSQEKYEEYDVRDDAGSRNISIQKPNLASEVVYVFPIVVIILIELLFILTDLHYGFAEVFALLEVATDNNLFRVMGIALIVLGIYPLLGSNDIDKRNGYVLFIIGFLVFLRGIGDMTSLFYILYDRVIHIVDPFFALFVIIVLTAVVINILKVSFDKYGGFSKIEHQARKVETHMPHVNKPSGKFDDGSRKHPKSNKRHFQGHSKSNNDSHGYSKPAKKDSSNHAGNSSSHAKENPEDLPIYEEDYIYIENPDDPKRPIRRKILKKVKRAAKDDDYYGDVLEEGPQEKKFNTNHEDFDYSSRKRIRKD